MNLSFNGIVVSAHTNTHAYSAFLETLLNYNRDEGETLLASQGWVNHLNGVPNLTKTATNADRVTPAGWLHNQSTPLKKATAVFYKKNHVLLHVRPHLDAFQTGSVLVPYVEIKLELFCNTPEFFLFGSKSTAKRSVTLDAADLNVKL